MTDKDPKDMTASELLRKAADQDAACHSTGIDELAYLMGINDGTCYSVRFEALADKIDVELAQARELSLRRGAELWAKANGWPDFRDGEDFGQWLDRCAIPRPRYEDGELVQFGDDGLSEIRLRRCYLPLQKHVLETTLVYEDGEQIVLDEDGRVKRPAPEVLGADDLRLLEGETVYDVETGEAYIVRLPCAGTGKTFFEGGGYRDPAYLTHTPPDTQERIDREKMVGSKEYWSCTGISCMRCPSKIDGELPSKHYGVRSCSIAQGVDIARRQRELNARTGGAE